MNITQRLIAGFGVMIVVTALATGVGWYVSREAAQRTTLISTTDVPLLKKVNQIFADLKNARLEEKGFLLDKNPEALDIANRHLDEASTLLMNIHDETREEELRGQCQTAIKLIDDYRANLSKVVELWTQRGLKYNEGIQGSLREASHRVEELIETFGIAELHVLILMCRRHEKDYLLRGDKKYVEAIAKRIEEFQDEMESFGLPASKREELGTLLSEYYQGVSAIVGINDKISSAVQEMDRDAAKLGQQAETFRQAAYESIDRNINKAVSSLSIFLYILIAAVAIGVLMGMYTVRSITGPIGRIIAGFAESVGQVSSSSDQVSSAGQSLAEGTSQQAAAIQEASSSIEEISSMTKQNSEHAQQADTIMKEANRIVVQANQSMLELTQGMEDHYCPVITS